MKDGSPQTEDGFTRIANELFEAMILKMPCRIPSMFLVFMAVMRETYGFKRKNAFISTKRFSQLTGIVDRQLLYRAKKQAIESHLINVIPADYKNRIMYSINKRFNEWENVVRPDYKLKMSSARITSVVRPDDALYVKETIKETIGIVPPLQQDKNGHIPYSQIMNLYNEILVPPLSVCKFMNPGRKQHIKARWNQFKEIQNLDWWKSYFECISEEDWMMGRKKLKGGDTWLANFDYVIREKCIIKIREERSSTE